MASLSMLFVTALVVVLAALVRGYESGTTYSAKCNPFVLSATQTLVPHCELVKGSLRHPLSHAYGTFVDEVLKDGWGKLWLHGDETLDGWYQSGFLEGALSGKRIYQHYVSWYSYQFPASAPLTPETVAFLDEQLRFAKRLSLQDDAVEEEEKTYRATLRKLLAQFQGLVDGQNAGAESEEEKLSLKDILLLEAAGDLYDIIPAVNPKQFKLKAGQLSAEEFNDEYHRVVSCSAIIKVSPTLDDVFVGHNSWTTYQSMLRIYKHYDLDGGAYQSSHSSKPGLLYSKDDFYVLPKKQMVVSETTNGVMNDELYKLVTPRSLLSWQRLPIVNTLADNAADWVKIVSKYSSGTYANQWMVIDMKKFTPGAGPAEKDFMWIVEQAPGMSVAHDVTQKVRETSFWSSYNVPYDEKVYVASGFQKAYETYGDQYSYSKCPRAQIFARNESQATTFEGVQRLLRYNDFENDPLSLGNAGNAISSRYDLRTTNAKSYGGVDTKVTSFSRVMGGGKKVPFAVAQLGPTHDQQKPFVWSTSPYADQIHLGQPDVFDFDFSPMDYYAH